MPSSPLGRIAVAGVLPLAAAFAFVAPGAASATIPTPQCTGSNIEGAGSTLQEPVQNGTYIPAFESTEYAKYNCSGYVGKYETTETYTELVAGHVKTKTRKIKHEGPKPKVKYNSATGSFFELGSGSAKKDWGAAGHPSGIKYGEIAFAATDEAPNAAEVSEMESAETEKGQLITIPILQAAVAVPIHLPSTCTANSTKFPGRWDLTNAVLEQIWAGQITTWGEASEKLDSDNSKAGDTLHCTEPTETELAITRVVRQDKSGTTNAFKKYLYQIDAEHNIRGTQSWLEIASGSANTEWPGVTTHSFGSGTGKLLTTEHEAAGSIGYANLANVRAKGWFTNPAETEKNEFWAPVQDNGTNPEKAKFADPSTKSATAAEDTSTVQESNCANTQYVNGNGSPFPPSEVIGDGANALWNETTSEPVEAHYPICVLTYDEAFTNYGTALGDTFATGEAQTAVDFLQFIVNPKGGEKALKKHDYLALPAGQIQAEAEEGALAAGAGGL